MCCSYCFQNLLTRRYRSHAPNLTLTAFSFDRGQGKSSWHLKLTDKIEQGLFFHFFPLRAAFAKWSFPCSRSAPPVKCVYRQRSEKYLWQVRDKGGVKAGTVDIQDVPHTSCHGLMHPEGQLKARTSERNGPPFPGNTFQHLLSALGKQWHFRFVTGRLDKCILSAAQCGRY